MEDVLHPMLEANTNRDVADVINYIVATDFAIERLKKMPLRNRLIRETHAVLMEGFAARRTVLKNFVYPRTG